MSDVKWTPGPWRWEINEKHKVINLCGGKPKYDLTVMDFVRYGMSFAAPRFIDGSDLQILTRAEKFSCVVEGREHHKDWFKGINHPDANLIAAAPELYEALYRSMKFIESHVADPDMTEEMCKAWNDLQKATPYEALAKARGDKQ